MNLKIKRLLKKRKAKKAIERYSSKIEPEEPEEQQQEKNRRKSKNLIMPMKI